MKVAKEHIKLKGTVDGVKIYLDGDCDFSEITSSLYETLRQFRKFFGDGHCNIYFVGRELTPSDKMRLEAISTAMLPESTLNYGDRKVIKADDELEKTLELPKELKEEIHNDVKENENSFEEIKEVVTSNFKSSRARFYEGVVRSGKTVESDGHLTLVGNVEEGGKISAVGNVIVMGSINGSVEAGCMGNDNAYIIALDFNPTDVRISKTHRVFEKNNSTDNKLPQKAYLINNQICTDVFLVEI